MSLINYILLFFMYSYSGWVAEVIYCSHGKVAYNRGFVFGPVCPIYGFGAILMILITNNINYNLFVVFGLGVVFPSILEYLTSYVMEKLFKRKWWDYSKYKFNLNGRICLLNSFLFGVMSVVVIYFIQPFFMKILNNLSNNEKSIIAVSLLLFYAVDLVFTTYSLIQYDKNNRFSRHFTNSFPFSKKLN